MFRRLASGFAPDEPLRLIATSKQLIFDLPPACAKNARQSADSDAVHAGCSCVAHHCEQRRFYIRRVTAGFVAEPDLHIAGSHWSSRSPNRRAGIDHAPSDADWQLTVPIGTHRTNDIAYGRRPLAKSGN